MWSSTNLHDSCSLISTALPGVNALLVLREIVLIGLTGFFLLCGLIFSEICPVCQLNGGTETCYMHVSGHATLSRPPAFPSCSCAASLPCSHAGLLCCSYAEREKSVVESYNSADAFGKLSKAASDVAEKQQEMSGADLCAMYIALLGFIGKVYPDKLDNMDQVLTECHKASLGSAVVACLSCRCFAAAYDVGCLQCIQSTHQVQAGRCCRCAGFLNGSVVVLWRPAQL